MAPETQMAALVRLYLHLNLENDIKAVLNVYMNNKSDTNMQVQTWKKTKIKEPHKCKHKREKLEQQKNDQGAVAANEYMESRNEKGDAARMQVADHQTLRQTFNIHLY